MKSMKATGIVKRIDELGNINIPKEIRKQLGLRESTPMELFVDKDSIILKKYVSEKCLIERIKDFESAFADLKFEMNEDQVSQIDYYISGIKALLNRDV